MKTNYKWFVVAMLWFVCFFNYADRQAIFSVFDPIKGEMRLNDAQLGVIGASFMWVYAAAAPLAGLIGDRFRRKTLILGGLIFWSLITVATAFSKNYTHLVICRALEGFGEAFYFPCLYRKVRLSFFSYTYRHPVLTVNLPLYTITLR